MHQGLTVLEVRLDRVAALPAQDLDEYQRFCLVFGEEAVELLDIVGAEGAFGLGDVEQGVDEMKVVGLIMEQVQKRC